MADCPALARPVAVLTLAVLFAGCGGSAAPAANASPSATATVAQACRALTVHSTESTLAQSDQPTAGFQLPGGTQPVGIVRDLDGVSVWLLGTGTNTVMHVTASGSATSYPLPASGLGIQLSQGTDGTVWVPEQNRAAVVALASDGTARECSLPGKGRQPSATSAAADGSVWVSEAAGGAIARLQDGKFTEFPIGVEGVKGAEVLAASDGGAWFTVMGAPVLGHVSAQGQVERIPIGGSGTNLGLLETPDRSVWVADFGGDRVVRVAPDHSTAVWTAPVGAKPQGLAIGPAGVVWVTESGADELASVRGSELQPAYKTGQWPDHIAVTTDGWAWFTEYNQDRLGRILLPAT